jgi:IS5 family transposase
MSGMKHYCATSIDQEDIIMLQPGLFDMEDRLRRLEAGGDPLVTLRRAVDFELFRPLLEPIREKPRKSNAGRKPLDDVLMFKVLVLQSLYNLGDDALEFQITDRLSFQRFLQLPPNEKAPRQRNTRQENEIIKNGDMPEEWDETPHKQRQKDVDARWAVKNDKTYYGYKNHVNVDVKHKFIRNWAVTDAARHDSQVFEELIDDDNTRREAWADSAYFSGDILDKLREWGFRQRIQRKGDRGRALTEREKQGNRTRARTRARVEHVFGMQKMRAGDLVIRTIGIARARCKIGLRNLAYNLSRHARLAAKCA